MSNISEQLADIQYGQRVAELELQLEQTRAKLSAKGSALRMATKKLTELQQHVDLNERIATTQPEPPQWLNPRRALKTKTATVCVMLSDTHFDEVVNPKEVNSLNAYNRSIAEARLRRFFDKSITIPRDQFGGMTYDGIVVFIGGDMISGDIHEELRETNEDTILGTLLHWSEQLAAGIDMLSNFYENVHVVSVCGNHGRRTRKERGKLRARDSFDWLLAHMTRRAVETDNVTWQIPEETDARVQVHNTKYLLTHGNLGFSGGGGISGAMPAIARGDLKRRQREAAGGEYYDILLVGHWHTYRTGGEFIMNGTLKGTDEYVYSRSFGLEPPQQALWLETPEYGPFGHTPIFCAPMLEDGRIDRKAEGW
jgi:predicted phosphodiesterase